MGIFLKLFVVVLLVWGANKLVFAVERPTHFEMGGFLFKPTSKNPCQNHACYPSTGNLIIGREKNLRASSTCGLTGEERFCMKNHFSNIKKCYRCDSRPEIKSPQVNHGVQQMNRWSQYSSQQPWWQSENGVEDVSIQFDLESVFHVTHMILSFKTYPPKAMYIEKSNNFGKTWTVARYFAENCTDSFPGVPTGSVVQTDVICNSKWSSPVHQGKVIYRVLSPKLNIVDPYSEEIQNLLEWTNVRFRFLKLHTFDGDEPSGENKENYYYAIQNLIVRGSCICHGHAAKCIPAEDNSSGNTKGMVHSRCECQHNTKGNQCELCDANYDLPWKPALVGDINMCKNNH